MVVFMSLPNSSPGPELDRAAKQRWTEAFARELLTAWVTSGQPLAEYAQENSLPLHRLLWWRRRLHGSHKTPAAVAWIPANVVGEAPSLAAARCVVRLNGAAALEVFDVSPDWVAALISRVGAP